MIRLDAILESRFAIRIMLVYLCACTEHSACAVGALLEGSNINIRGRRIDMFFPALPLLSAVSRWRPSQPRNEIRSL